MPTKSAVLNVLLETVRAELQAMQSVAAMARDEATSSETKSEGKYDTRATEASYLARGQAWRIAELGKLAAWLETLSGEQALDEAVVQVGALVQIEGARQELLFVAPIGGTKAEVDGQAVQVISPSSPLGAAMAELEVGDAFEVDSPRGLLEYEIISID